MSSIPTASPGPDRPAAESGLREPATQATATPCLRLYTERLTMNVGDSFSPQEEDQLLPVLALGFDYQGVMVRANDKREGAGAHVRNLPAEARARQILESFGPLDLACL